MTTNMSWRINSSGFGFVIENPSPKYPGECIAWVNQHLDDPVSFAPGLWVAAVLTSDGGQYSIDFIATEHRAKLCAEVMLNLNWSYHEWSILDLAPSVQMSNQINGAGSAEEIEQYLIRCKSILSQLHQEATFGAEE